MENKNIELQQLSKEDITIINTLRNDWENKKLSSGVRYPITLENDLDWYEKMSTDHSNKNIYFAIKYIQTNQTIGIIELSNIDWINRNAYVGIQIVKSETKKGFGEAAINLITEYAFNVLNLRKILANVAIYNSASIKLLEKCGFIQEGILKKQIYYDDTYYDLIVFGKFKI